MNNFVNKFCFVLFYFAFARLAAGEEETSVLVFRTWHFEKGGKMVARAADFERTNLIVLSTNLISKYSFPVSQLTAEDRTNALRARYELLCSKYQAEGRIEITSKALSAYPEKFCGKNIWLECEFYKIESSGPYKDLEVYFSVTDKEGETIWGLRAAKESSDYTLAGSTIKKVKMDDKVVPLKRGDFIRIEGIVYPVVSSDDPWIEITSVEKIPFNPQKLLEKTAAKRHQEK